MNAIIMDLDGCLCDISPYLHLGFDGFMEAAVTVALPNPEMVVVCQEAERDGVAVLVLTGRFEDMREPTLAWMRRHGAPCTAAYFRQNDDYRANAAVKWELLAAARADGWNPTLAYDDDPDVCEMWLAQGIPVVRVGSWDQRLT